MKYLIIGLGNPGERFAGTRHNLGREFLLHTFVTPAHRGPITGTPCHCCWKEHDGYYTATNCEGEIELSAIIPQYFMNESAKVLTHLKGWEHYKGRVIIVYDEIEKKLGHAAFRKNHDRGARGHNGLRSFFTYLQRYPLAEQKQLLPYFFSLGVGKPDNDTTPIHEYVLEKFSREEQQQIDSWYAPLYQSLLTHITTL